MFDENKRKYQLHTPMMFTLQMYSDWLAKIPKTLTNFS